MFASIRRMLQSWFSNRPRKQAMEILPPTVDEPDPKAAQQLILQDHYTNAEGEQTRIEARGDGIHLQKGGQAEDVVPMNSSAAALSAIDEDIRYQIARKISLLVPTLADSKKQMLMKHVFKALFLLAQDQVPRVRRMIAEELRDSYDAPQELIRKLAWDEEVLVAAPVLEFSPLLTDHDLVEIIAQSDIPGVMEAISKRKSVSGDVTDAIVRNVTQSRLRKEDVRIINNLLENKGATFTETSLETIVDEAPDHEIWHESLIERPELTTRMLNKVARFVSQAMILELKERGLIEEDMGTNLTKAISSRLQNPKIDRAREADRLAVEMFTQGTLDAEAVIAGQEAGEYEFVIAAVSLLADFPKNITELIFESQDPKAITAICWKAKLPMRVAIPLQLKVAKVPYTDILYAKGGKDFPLTPAQMKKALEDYVAKAA